MPSNLPTISIVIPSLNQAPFLDDAIASALDQQYPHLQLIVMDGGSMDRSLDIIRKHEPRLTYWTSGADDGPAAALNAGFQHATGDVLAFLNADDMYLKGSLGRIGKAFQSDPAADVISGHGYFIDRDGTLGAPTYSDRWSTRRFSYGCCVLVQPASFFRRRAFERSGGFRPGRSLCWDMKLWADMAQSGAQFRTMDEFLAAFRLHPGSITGSPSLQQARRDHARAVMATVRGRPESTADRAWELAYRCAKFSQHPGRTLRQRLYFFRTLRRWSL